MWAKSNSVGIIGQGSSMSACRNSTVEGTLGVITRQSPVMTCD